MRLTTVIVVSLVSLSGAVAATQSQDAAVTKAQAALAAIIAGDASVVEAQYDAAMKAAMPAGRLMAGWKTVQLQAGAYKSCDKTSRVVPISDKTMVITQCDFERARIDVQFAFDKDGLISGLAFRPGGTSPVAYTLPVYASASAFTESSVTVGSGEWALPGALTLPTGTERVPAVVLVHGSGPGDRDAAVGPNAPFRDLAVGLSSRGIAVLRYDKRTRVHGNKIVGLAGFTVREESIDDALEGVTLLRAHPRVDPNRVYVLGHSLGGMLIPRIASADPTLAGVIVMAGPARPMEDAIAAQTRYLANADGAISAEEHQGITQADALVATVRGLSAADAAKPGLISGAPASYWLDLRGYDAPSAAARIKGPMLVLQGERDYQVTMEDYAKWKAALASRHDVDFHSYPALNHLFLAGTGTSLPAEYMVRGHVAEEVVRDIAAWILRQR